MLMIFHRCMFSPENHVDTLELNFHVNSFTKMPPVSMTLNVRNKFLTTYERYCKIFLNV